MGNATGRNARDSQGQAKGGATTKSNTDGLEKKSDVGGASDLQANIEQKKQLNIKAALEDKTYLQLLTDETKTAMAGACLVGSIWREYWNEHKCDQCDENDQLDPLGYFYIHGGTPRDIMWNVSANDIDIVINTRELNKLHVLHLEKYHSTSKGQKHDSPCVLWQHYRNKIQARLNKNDIETQLSKLNKNETELTESERDEFRMKLVESTYHLNAKFFVEILKASIELSGKLEVHHYKSGVFNIGIIKDFEYCGFNVNGFDLDLLDCFKGITVEDSRDDSHLVKQKYNADVDHSLYFSNNKRKSNFIVSTRRLPNLDELKYDNDDFDVTIHSDTEDLGTDYDEDNEDDEDDNGNGTENGGDGAKDNVNNGSKTRSHDHFESTKSMRYVASEEFNENNDRVDTMRGIKEDDEYDDFGDLKENFTLRTKKTRRKMKIQMMIYPYGFKDRSRGIDLTINTMIIHLSDILFPNKDYNDKILNFDWKCAIRNPRKEINAIQDTIEAHVRTWGKNVEDKQHVVHQQRNYYHVIRIAKMCGKLSVHPNVKNVDDLTQVIDNELIVAHNNEYDTWLTKANFQDKNQCKDMGKTFCQYYVNKWVKLMGKKPIKHIPYRMKAFELLKFNDKFSDIINNNYGDAKKEFEKALEQYCCDKDDDKQTRKKVFLTELRK